MEWDENGSIRDFMRRFTGEQTGGGRVKLPSELTWEPPVDLSETDREIIAVVDLAGMDVEDIHVLTDGRMLKISGFRKNTNPPGIQQYHKLEIQVGPFERVIELPVPVDHSRVVARYDRGLLRIRIAKIDQARQVKKIPID